MPNPTPPSELPENPQMKFEIEQKSKSKLILSGVAVHGNRLLFKHTLGVVIVPCRPIMQLLKQVQVQCSTTCARLTRCDSTSHWQTTLRGGDQQPSEGGILEATVEFYIWGTIFESIWIKFKGFRPTWWFWWSGQDFLSWNGVEIMPKYGQGTISERFGMRYFARKLCLFVIDVF